MRWLEHERIAWIGVAGAGDRHLYRAAQCGFAWPERQPLGRTPGSQNVRHVQRGKAAGPRIGNPSNLAITDW